MHLSAGSYAVGRWSLGVSSAADLLALVLTAVDALEAEHAAFVAALPRTGTPSLDAALRWFAQSAVLLTKGVQDQVRKHRGRIPHSIFFCLHFFRLPPPASAPFAIPHVLSI